MYKSKSELIFKSTAQAIHNSYTLTEESGGRLYKINYSLLFRKEGMVCWNLWSMMNVRTWNPVSLLRRCRANIRLHRLTHRLTSVCKMLQAPRGDRQNTFFFPLQLTSITCRPACRVMDGLVSLFRCIAHTVSMFSENMAFFPTVEKVKTTSHRALALTN